MKFKDLYLSILSENENFLYVDSDTISEILDVNISKSENYVKIDFLTSYGKKGQLVVKYTKFLEWYMEHINEFPDVFKSFAKEYMAHSKQTPELEEEPVTEIVDEEGNLISNDDKPNNATNTMVGSKNTWDLERLYKSTIPKSIRFYSGDLGIGIITW